MEDMTTSRTTYRNVAIALGLLLAATLGVAMVHLGVLGHVAALGIAIFKAVLVALFFMHLRYENVVNRVFAAGGLLWLSILIGLTLTDYLSRG